MRCSTGPLAMILQRKDIHKLVFTSPHLNPKLIFTSSACGHLQAAKKAKKDKKKEKQ